MTQNKGHYAVQGHSMSDYCRLLVKFSLSTRSTCF